MSGHVHEGPPGGWRHVDDGSDGAGSLESRVSALEEAGKQAHRWLIAMFTTMAVLGVGIIGSVWAVSWETQGRLTAVEQKLDAFKERVIEWRVESRLNAERGGAGDRLSGSGGGVRP